MGNLCVINRQNGRFREIVDECEIAASGSDFVCRECLNLSSRKIELLLSIKCSISFLLVVQHILGLFFA